MYILLQMPQQLIPVCTYLPMRQAVSGMTVDTWQLARENLSSTWLHVMRYIRSPQSQQNPGFVLNVGSGSAARWTGLCIKTFISGILALYTDRLWLTGSLLLHGVAFSACVSACFHRLKATHATLSTLRAISEKRSRPVDQWNALIIVVQRLRWVCESSARILVASMALK
jgi:hypothetical protein